MTDNQFICLAYSIRNGTRSEVVKLGDGPPSKACHDYTGDWWPEGTIFTWKGHKYVAGASTVTELDQPED